MNRRMFLKGSLVAIGTLMILPTEPEASKEIVEAYDFTYDGTKWEERTWCSKEWVQEQYYKGTIHRRWIPKEYLYKKDHDIELSTESNGHIVFVKGKAKKGYKVFLDMKDGRKYVHVYNNLLAVKEHEDYVYFYLFGAVS